MAFPIIEEGGGGAALSSRLACVCVCFEFQARSRNTLDLYLKAPFCCPDMRHAAENCRPILNLRHTLYCQNECHI